MTSVRNAKFMYCVYLHMKIVSNLMPVLPQPLLMQYHQETDGLQKRCVSAYGRVHPRSEPNAAAKVLLLRHHPTMRMTSCSTRRNRLYRTKKKQSSRPLRLVSSVQETKGRETKTMTQGALVL